VRITAQLIRAQDDKHIWAEEFERDGSDILSLQGDLARSIARKISLQLTPKEQAELSNRQKVDPQAHEAYLRGRYFWNKRTVPDYQKSILNFQEAINKDPNYSEAYAGLADAYALLGSSGNSPIPRAEAMEKARQAALTALALDEDLAEAHTSLAFVRMHYDWKFEAAEKEFRRAIELNPSYVTAHHWYAYNLAATGRREEALQEIKIAQELDPLSVIVNTDVAEFLSYLDRNQEALHYVQRALELDPSFFLAHLRLSEIYDAQAKPADALEEAKKSLSFATNDSWAIRAFAIQSFHAGREGDAAVSLKRLLRYPSRAGIELDVAAVYAATNNKDAAVLWLNKAVALRNGGLILLNASHSWDNLRTDPRYHDLCKRIGLPG
jgi:tetratricopeptide (TPR) repeat protein